MTAYVVPIVTVTASYALFQAANNTAVMAKVSPETRGVISGMLNLSRNLGLITGASAMGAVFAMAAGTTSFATADASVIAASMRTSFAVAAVLVVAALMAAVGSQAWVRSRYRVAS